MNVVTALVLISALTTYSLCGAKEETKCETCRALSRGILDGLDKTKKKNFEGGDVAWEEKKLGTYKTSETRLVEILESYACGKDNHRCNSILEDKEESIYNWYKNLQEEIPLFDYLCVQEAKLCCPDGTFGADCEECPKGESNDICFGRGKCEGAGDREGFGKCVCEDGYSGELCNECAERYFSTFSNDTFTQCSLCHKSCKTCKGNKSTDCLTCMEGYREEENIDNEEEKKCSDINECVEQSSNICPVGTYCLNNEGSYSCEGSSAKTAEDDSGGENVESDVEDSLSNDDIKRLLVAVVICVIGTAAASGNLIWTALFFCSLLGAALWWASDKSEQLVNHLKNRHQEL